MQHVKSKLLLSALSVAVLSSCGGGPKVTICISDPGSQGFQCVGADDKVFKLDYSKSENYVALPPNDMRTLIEYCGLKDESRVAVSQRADRIQYLAGEAKNGSGDNFGD